MNSNVTLANWRLSPWNRWAFRHVSEILPVACITASSALASPLSRTPRDLSKLAFDANGRRWTIGDMLTHTETDGFLVLQDGKILFEWYANDLNATTPHIVFSVSKSITAILSGILVDRGELDPSAPVTHYIPEAASSAYGDCTVQHVLDMTVDVVFDEDYLDATGPFARYRTAMGWNPVSDPSRAPDLHSFLLTLQREGRMTKTPSTHSHLSFGSAAS
jgi:CubicO group peptidase (beta-lactamase class C family)